MAARVGAPRKGAAMSLSEIVLRMPYGEDEVRLVELDGGEDGSAVEIDGDEWVVMMHVPPRNAEARRRLILVRAESCA
jgi:hypothetical protein